MNCPKCGKRTRVKNSRHSDSSSDDKRNTGLTDWARREVGWYTSDWVARERLCPHCGWAKKTIEIIEPDLSEMIRLWRLGETPHGGDNG